MLSKFLNEFLTKILQKLQMQSLIIFNLSPENFQCDFCIQLIHADLNAIKIILCLLIPEQTPFRCSAPADLTP